MKHILIADTNPDLCSALALLLQTRANAEIVGQVCQLETLLSQTAAAKPEIIIFSWELPVSNRAEYLLDLRKMAPGCKIIVTSIRPEAAGAAMQAGADGFACKIYPPESLLVEIEKSLRDV